MKDDELKETAERRIKQNIYNRLFDDLMVNGHPESQQVALERFKNNLKRLCDVRKIIDGEQRRS